MSDAEFRRTVSILTTIQQHEEVDFHDLCEKIEDEAGPVFQSCQRLVKHGLLEKTADSEYHLTDTGTWVVYGSLRLPVTTEAADGFHWVDQDAREAQLASDTDVLDLVR